MARIGPWLIAAVATLTLVWLVVLAINGDNGRDQGPTKLPLPEGDSAAPLSTSTIDPPKPTPPPPDEPVIVEPPDELTTPDPTPATVLPPLNSSDSFVSAELQALTGGGGLLRFLAPEELIRSFVVFVHNVGVGELPQTNLPYRHLEAEMPVHTLDDKLFEMDAAAHRRFDQIISAFMALDTAQSLALYRTLTPLFQEASSELGDRRNFDDLLKQAIDRVLTTELPSGPFQLVKPSVMYLYADAGTEDLTAIEKQLIRLGPRNTDRLKGKLREFRARL